MSSCSIIEIIARIKFQMLLNIVIAMILENGRDGHLKANHVTKAR